MKEFVVRNKSILLIVVLSFLPLFSFFNPTLIYTQDGYTHLVRGAAYFKALQTLNIPPRWAGDLNYGYGMPLFVFVFQFPYQIFSLLLSLGFSLSYGFRIIMVTSYVFSGITIFWFSKEFFKDEKNALIVTLLYQFFPYRFTDILLRGSIGECITFAIFPLLLLGIIRLNKRKTIFPILLISLSACFLLLSHLATGGGFILVSIIFSLFFIKGLRNQISALLSIGFGFLLSSYYTFAAILEHNYTFGDLFAKNLYKENFVPLEKMFSLSIINEKNTHIGDVPVNLGVVFVVLFVTLLVLLFVFRRFKNQDRKIVLFSAIIVFLSLFMCSIFSKPLWDNITLLRQFQFPWRFLAPAGFGLALIGGVSFSVLKNKIFFWCVCLVIIVLSIPFWIPQLGYKEVNEKEMWNYPLTTTYFGETDVIWSAGPAKSYPVRRIEFVSGRGIIANFIKANNSQKFSISADENSQLVSHIEYFPGWKVYVDAKQVPIQFQDPNHRGELEFSIPAGKHIVSIIFVEDKIRLLTDLISLLSIIFLLPFAIILKRML